MAEGSASSRDLGGRSSAIAAPLFMHAFPKSADLGTVATSLPAKAGQMAGAWGAPRAATVVGVMGIRPSQGIAGVPSE